MQVHQGQALYIKALLLLLNTFILIPAHGDIAHTLKTLKHAETLLLNFAQSVLSSALWACTAQDFQHWLWP